LSKQETAPYQDEASWNEEYNQLALAAFSFKNTPAEKPKSTELLTALRSKRENNAFDLRKETRK
jgi:hypothetical protein